MDLMILQWNANGIKNHSHELIALIKLGVLKPHVICIQETKLGRKAKFHIPGYTAYRKDRKKDSPGVAGGGLITLVDNRCTSLSIDADVGNLETQVVAVTLAGGSKEIRVANVYHRVSSPTSVEELKKLRRIVGKTGVILGDFNAHHPMWSDREQACCHGKVVEEWLQSEDSPALAILNDDSNTRYDSIHHSWSALDLTIVTNDLATDSVWQVYDDTWGSDHCPIITSIGTPPQLEEDINPQERWDFAKADWHYFKQKCLEINPDLIASDCPDLFARNLTKAILAAAASAIPTKTPYTARCPVPWWNSDIAKARRARRKALNRSKKDKSAFPQLAEARKKVKELITEAKTASWQEFCGTLNDKSNAKVVWSKIHAIKGKKRTRIPKVTGAHSNKEKADLFANHFASVSNNTNHSPMFLANKGRIASDPPKQPHANDKLFNTAFTLEEFQRAINHKKGTAPGADKTSYEMLKKLPNDTMQLLLQLYNVIWEKGHVPSQWKTASVVPIPKPGKAAGSVDSYRPISLTSNMCKGMEAMVNNRLTHHLETGSYLKPDQSGFRKGHRCLDHIFRLENEIKQAQLKKQYLAAVFLDFRKAFDMVWHDGLLKKLGDCGIKGQMANFIQSYLNGRSLNVKIGDALSDTLYLDNGTPQGSIISPTLFNIMINDLFEDDEVCRTSKFADDGAFWERSKEVSKIRRNLQSTLNGIEKWCDKWGFSLSTEKTVGVLFKRKGQRQDLPRLSIRGKSVRFEKSAKFLGVIFLPISHLEPACQLPQR